MPERPLRVLSHVPSAILGRVSRELPSVELAQIPGEGELPPGVEGQVLLTFTWGAANMRQALARGVRWVHAFGTGVDDFPFAALEGRTLTCSRGASAIPIAEWVLAMLLAAEKRLPDAWLHEPPEHWNAADLGGLHGKTLGLIGLGGIGQAVATRALAFGLRVLALRRTVKPSPLAGVELARGPGRRPRGARLPGRRGSRAASRRPLALFASEGAALRARLVERPRLPRSAAGSVRRQPTALACR